MKKKLSFLFTTILLFSFSFTQAQEEEIIEPDFAGECFLVRADGSYQLLEKHFSQVRTAASTGLILTGVGKVRDQLQIDGCCSSISYRRGEDISLIVKNVDNHTDPLAVVKIFKFEQKKKYRRAEISFVSSLGYAKDNTMSYIPFAGAKYGTSSYIIEPQINEPGEYGVIIMNPNNTDQKQYIVASFAVQ